MCVLGLQLPEQLLALPVPRLQVLVFVTELAVPGLKLQVLVFSIVPLLPMLFHLLIPARAGLQVRLDFLLREGLEGLGEQGQGREGVQGRGLADVGQGGEPGVLAVVLEGEHRYYKRVLMIFENGGPLSTAVQFMLQAPPARV